MYRYVVLSGVMASVLVIGPSFEGSDPAEGNRLLMTIKIRSTASFGGYVKPSATFRKILLHLKIPSKYEQR
jgi:hypothetical protein